MNIKKAITQIHLWLGLTSGLVVFILGLTGATYAFVDELRPVFYADRLYITPEEKAVLPLSTLLSIAEKAVDNKSVTRVEISSQPDRTYMFRSQKLDPEGLTYWDYYKYYYRVYVNSYTGKVVKVENTKYEFFQLVLGLHMRMLFGEKVGHFVVGGAVLMFVILLFSGLVLWWPKKWTKSGREKSFHVKWDASSKRVNYDLHNVLGFYACIFLLVTSLSGLVWVFEWMENSARFIANGAQKVEKTKPILSDTTFSGSGSGVDKAFLTARKRNPEAYSYLINFPPKANGTINISAYMKNWNRYDRTQENYDRYTGKLLRGASFAALNGGDQIYQLNYDLHTGSVMALPGKILTFFASLIAASLPVTGFVIWWGRGKKKEKRIVKKKVFEPRV
ncbi:PepSY-associated TM helix domain-containing protein [Dyadobacter subterraneus]|uniref:PepSY domain-containing protein n=1 Tax=Dyadobacter subterraneus TaxID=2773304 RepID=A0ABR9W7G3_9BACT|nr:PepSY-associated TM helix domain-containing protein [Dyadobacter subterraneus]MBE9461395.1 PepSY domain-containing protein [Dyadobacter subterraneus]